MGKIQGMRCGEDERKNCIVEEALQTAMAAQGDLGFGEVCVHAMADIQHEKLTKRPAGAPSTMLSLGIADQFAKHFVPLQHCQTVGGHAVEAF